MWFTLLWIVLVYALAVAAVHVAYDVRIRRKLDSNASDLKYVVVTRQNQHQIERVIRALSLYGWLKGYTIHVTVLDEESTDLTVPILERLAENSDMRMDIVIVRQGEALQVDGLELASAQIVYLNVEEDWSKLPFVRL